ncbi:MAG TPA: hypothetical protein PKB06_03895, partial [Actinotalea sp.]|nr:hypothetical protein [Actinotalea sp.]
RVIALEVEGGLWSSDPLPFDSLPLDPALTCPVAVDLLVGIIDGSVAAGGVVLVPPVYQPHGSVAPPRVRSSAPTPTTQ